MKILVENHNIIDALKDLSITDIITFFFKLTIGVFFGGIIPSIFCLVIFVLLWNTVGYFVRDW